jgi:hypothetical protein
MGRKRSVGGLRGLRRSKAAKNASVSVMWLRLILKRRLLKKVVRGETGASRESEGDQGDEEKPGCGREVVASVE